LAALGRVRVAARFAPPSPVGPKIGLVLGLADGRMPVTEEQLETGIAKVVVVAADIDKRCCASSRGCDAFAAVREDLGAKGPFLAHIALDQPRARESAIALRRIDVLGHAAVGGPGTETFLSLDWQLCPSLADAQAIRRNFRTEFRTS
jgi:hypothetical protein